MRENQLVTCLADLNLVCVSKHMPDDASVKASVVGEREASFGTVFGDFFISVGLSFCARL